MHLHSGVLLEASLPGDRAHLSFNSQIDLSCKEVEQRHKFLLTHTIP